MNRRVMNLLIGTVGIAGIVGIGLAAVGSRPSPPAGPTPTELLETAKRASEIRQLERDVKALQTRLDTLTRLEARGSRHYDAPEHLAPIRAIPAYSAYDPYAPGYCYWSIRDLYPSDDSVHRAWIARQVADAVAACLAPVEHGPVPREVWTGTLMLNEDPVKGRILLTSGKPEDREIVGELYSPDAAVLKRMFALNFKKARVTGRYVAPENHPTDHVFWVKTVEAVD